jgi:hypothetical protein
MELNDDEIRRFRKDAALRQLDRLLKSANDDLQDAPNEPKRSGHWVRGTRRQNEAASRTDRTSQVASGKEDQTMKIFCETNPLSSATSRRMVSNARIA